MTKVESILQALFTLATAELTGVKVVRSRTARFGESELPALNILPSQDDALNYANQLGRHEFNVELVFNLPPQDIPDQAVDPFVKTLHQSIINSAELNALVAHKQYKNRQWDFDDADGSVVKLTVVYAFTYINSSNQL